jgi:hypothetical protein
MGTPDRIAMGIIAVMCSTMAVVALQSPQTWFLTYIMFPINTALGAWGFFCAYRPRKAKQERVIATALLLGMEVKSIHSDYDLELGAEQRYIASIPNTFNTLMTSYNVSGRNMYDVAALWLMEMGY